MNKTTFLSRLVIGSANFSQNMVQGKQELITKKKIK